MKIEKTDLINEENIYLTTYAEKAAYLRGRTIDCAISIEMKLAEILADFFNQDEIKRKFMFTTIFSNAELSFSSKAKIFSELMSNFFPDILSLFPDVLQDLAGIIHMRSRIDHSMLDNSPDFTQHRYHDRVQFVYFSDGARQRMVFSDEDFNRLMRSASKVLIALDHLKSKLTIN